METILFMIVIYIVYVVFFKAKKEDSIQSNINDDDEYQESKWKIINSIFFIFQPHFII